MIGLALEGGGARGAYHIGVVRAYLENGYEFDGFVGTSIGAINAAVLAQGDFDKASELWMSISMEQIFDVDEQHLLQLMNLNELKLDKSFTSRTKAAIAKIIGGKGISTSKMKTFLETYIDEEKIRRSGKDFGLVTVSLNERKPYEVFLEDIPHGKLVNYIMASASFPGFKPEVIGEKMFLDGGLYNNCPVNLLAEKGYDEIIAVRTAAPGIFRKADSAANVRYITSRENLGNILLFSPKNSEANITLGYYDGLRAIHNLRGRSYYISPVRLDDFYARLISLDDNVILEAGKTLDLPDMPAKRMLFEHIIPKLSTFLNLEKDYDYADFFIALLEHSAEQKGIDKYQVYDYDTLIASVKNSPLQEQEKEKNSLLSVVPIKGLKSKKTSAASLLSRHLLSQ